MKANNVTHKKNKLDNLILHIHPRVVPEKAIKFTLTWGLGGMAVLLIVFLLVTGILLRFVYVPTPQGAYDSVLNILNNYTFGLLVRNVHYWSATLLVIVSFLHLLRVFYTGAYSAKRGANWVIGLCLFILVVLMNFTGYLLPWDQLAYWAITVTTNMLEYIPVLGKFFKHSIIQGDEVGAQTLLVFYNLHTGLFPLGMIILMMFHFWKVRKAGGVVIPPEPDGATPKKVKVWPNLLVREFAVALVLSAFILLFSLFFDAPLQERANPLVSPNPAKAPWYFMGFQELLLHFQPVVAVLIVPSFIIGLLFYLPYLKNNAPSKGIWFLSQKGKKTALQASIIGVVITITLVISNEYIVKPSALSSFAKSGIIQLLVIAFIAWLMLRVQKSKYKANKAEALQALLSFIFSAFIVLTIIGHFFRGEGMSLSF